jgi:SAM-dependent methyltransferase
MEVESRQQKQVTPTPHRRRGFPDMSAPSTDQQHWSRFAREWIAWARMPNHDAFWAYRGSLVEFIGPGDSNALDVGCGEGRVSRELKELGYKVTACDPTAAFIEAAKELDSAHDYVVSAAADLPFETGRFGLVVAYNMLMDVDDMPAAVKEIRRVMKLGGQLIISIVHPIADHGHFEGSGPDRRFVLDSCYFGRQPFEAAEERGGLRMHFAGWSQPLEAYAAALENAGLAITSLREPTPSAASGMRKKWAQVPLFLWLKARPLAG